jgi:hypothetical protein
MRLLPLLLVVVAAAGCSERRKGPGADMKAAESWGGSADPHAGMGMNDPHAGMGMNDPHAGMGMNDPHAGMGVNDPHAGMGMTGPGGLPPPDPNRPIDPNKFLRGTIRLGPQAGGKAPPGVIFLSVRPADAQGNPAGPPLAVDILPAGAFPIAFDLSEAKAMIGGTAFAGDVVVIARLDQDQDVDTRQPGDLSGRVRATIPAQGLELVLDTVQP